MGLQQNKYQQGLYASLRAEAFCAALLDNGSFFDDFTIEYAGAFRRTYRNDINSIELDQQEQKEDKLTLELNRDGIYDKLPEGIFHQSKGSGRTAGLQDMVGEHRRYREEEKAARRFFQPIEQEIFRYAVMAEQEERSILFGTLTGQVSSSFFDFWYIDTRLPLKPAEMMIRMMPLQRRIKGNKEITARALSLLLDKEVNVQEVLVEDHVHENPEALFRTGDGARLGLDTVTGTAFNEPGIRWSFYIDDIAATELSSFTEGHPMGKFLARFTEIFVPLEIETRFEFIPEKKAAKSLEQEYIMGYGFYL